jgi:hypothetical protein
MENSQKKLSLSDIHDLEYSDAPGDYFWIHPALIEGYKTSEAKKSAIQRQINISNNEESIDTPDTLLTDYLCKCLDQRKLLIDKGLFIPPKLTISIVEYIDALIYLVKDLQSSYACNILGATNYHDDDFFEPTYASVVLQRLKAAFISANTQEASLLVRDLILEIFHVGYPWGSTPRFKSFLKDDEIDFIETILNFDGLR